MINKNAGLTAEQLAVRRKNRAIRTAKKYGFLFCILILQLVAFAYFYVYVHINAFIMAFQWPKPDGTAVFSLRAFEMLFERLRDPTGEVALAMRNTFIYFAFGFVMLPISFMTSYFMYKKIWGYRAFRILFFLPSVVSSVVWSSLYSRFISPDGPIAPLFAKIFKLESVPFFLSSSRYALGAVLGYSFWLGIAGSFIIFQGTMTRIPDSVIEAGKLDGIAWYRELFQIILPLMWPTISTMLIIRVSGIFTASGSVLLLTNGEWGTTSISFLMFKQVYNNADLNSRNFNYASAIGFFFSMLTIPLVLITRWLANKIEDVEY